MSKRTERILSLVFLIFLLIAGDRLLTYLLEPLSRAEYFLHDMKEMKKSGEYPDMIIIGNSRSVYGFDPRVFEEELGLDNVYNASVVGQQISSKYYIAEAMIEAFSPKIVIFDIEWQSLNDFGTTRTQAKLLGLDRLTGLSKIRYILEAFDFSEWIYALCKPYRFRDNLFREGSIAQNLRLKNWLRDTDYAENYYGTYKGYDKGSACSEKPFAIGSYGTFDEAEISAENKAYLDRMAELCRARNISLFIVSPPLTTMRQLNIGRYQEANDYYKAYASEKGVPYHNLNMLRDRDEIFPDSYFYDSGHLCEPGATEASRLYAQIIRDELEGKDTSDRFYASVDELRADISRVVAVGAEILTEGRTVRVRDLRCTAGTSTAPVIDIEVSADGKKYSSVGQVVPPEDSFDFVWERSRNKIRVKITARDAGSGTQAWADYSVVLE